MSLRREKNADLEKIFYDFMNYYKYKNLYQHNHDYNHNHNGNNNNHNHNNNNHNNNDNNHNHNNNNHNHNNNNHNHNNNNHNHNHNNHNHNNNHDNNHNHNGNNHNHNDNNHNHNDNNHNHNDNNHNHNDNNHNHNTGSSQNPNIESMSTPFYFLPPYRTDEYTQEYTTDSRATKVMMPANVCNTNETFPIIYTPNTNHTQERVNENTQKEAMYYKALFTDLNKNLMPYIENAVKENSYVGSPITDMYFDKESLAQIVSDILDKAKANPKLVAYITDLDPKVKELMKNIVEALLLGELFLVYRPNNKLNVNNMTSNSGMYDMNNMNNMTSMPNMNNTPYIPNMNNMSTMPNMNNMTSMPNMPTITNTTSMGMSPERYNNMYGDPKNTKPLNVNMDMYLNDCPVEEVIKPKTVANPYRSDDMQYFSN